MGRALGWVLPMMLCASMAGAVTITTNGAEVTGSIVGDLIVRADDVRVHDVDVSGSLSLQGADRLTMERFTVRGPRLLVNTDFAGTTGGSSSMRFSDGAFTGLGKGVFADYFVRWWNVSGVTETRVRKIMTIEASADVDAIRSDWHFADRNSKRADCYTEIVLNGAYNQAVRWRSDVKLPNIGCSANVNVRDTLIVRGKGPSRVILSSSATCDGTLAGCVGQWASSWRDCVIDMSGVAGGSSIQFQGGMTADTLERCKFTADDALYAFDIHKSVAKDNTFKGNVRFTDEYDRPLWKAGEGIVWCNNSVSGTVSVAPTLAAVAGAMVTNCAPVTPPPTTADTVRVVVKVPSLPATVTIVKQ